ncbi:hypothetical protein ZWY2020_011047 [Hordeum vulgare]|nr:hypothetical protein ZWY2020_011047 [Hordeum vulgare]
MVFPWRLAHLTAALCCRPSLLQAPPYHRRTPCRQLCPDLLLKGGMPGASTFRDCKILENMVKKHAEKGKLYAAVCAAPAVALGASGNLSSVMHEQTSFRGASCRIKGTD